MDRGVARLELLGNVHVLNVRTGSGRCRCRPSTPVTRAEAGHEDLVHLPGLNLTAVDIAAVDTVTSTAAAAS
jgi:hypothetical protein